MDGKFTENSTSFCKSNRRKSRGRAIEPPRIKHTQIVQTEIGPNSGFTWDIRCILYTDNQKPVMSLSSYSCAMRTVLLFCTLFVSGLFQASAMEAPFANSSEDPNIGACSLFDAGPNRSALTFESTPAPLLTSPSDNAAAPTLDAADVVSVYGASYTSVAYNFNPGWGQSGTVNSAFDPGTGNTVLEYANFNYQGTELTATNLSSMTHVHMDIWVAEGTDRQLKFTPVNNGTGTNEILVEVPLTPGSWNSVDLAKSAFTGMSWDNVFQLKFDGQFNGDGSANGDGWNVYLDNIYFWNDGSGTTTEITYVDVTFNVNMSNETVSVDGVFLAGGNDFGSPGDNPMTDAGNDIWTITKQVASPYTGNYTFLNGNCGDWSCKEDISGQDCASGQYNDRILNGITENHVVNTCFGECTTDGTCPAPPSVFHAVTFSVNTDNITVGPNGMYVGGGFLGGSDAHALTDNGNNNWSATIDLAEGTSGNWVFFNSPTHGGDWNTKENLEGLECADAANYNDRYLAPLSAPATIEYCFGECTADCPAPPTTVDVTFQVDMSQYEGSFGGVFVNGNYNNWCGSCNPMTDNGDGTWSATLALEPGTIQYKFTVDGWTAQEEFSGGESCTVTDGGFTNRTATFDAATDLGLVCFNSCGVCTTDILGCMDSTADNYDPAATADDGSCGNVEGAWNLTYMCVGSGLASCEWWSYSAPGDRGCLEDDLYVFNGDGSFQNVMGTQTWTETWQGVSEGCNAPVAPHNGSNAATYSLANGEITLNGLGAFLGLSKVVNGAEISNPADAASSITYALNSVDNNNLSVDIHVGGGWWRFTFTRATQGCTDSTADNYVSYVTTDDGSCSFTPGCTDDNAVNYDSAAQTDDGSCLYAVTFQVDMANYDLPAGATVFTNGAYNQWCGGCNALSDGDADGIWTGTFNLPAGDQEYKFTVNGWDAQESFNGNEACTTAPAEFVNRLTNISGPTTLPVVCWNTCEACADITNLTQGTGHTSIQAAIDAASAGDVIELNDGSYTIDTTVDVNKALTLQGESEAGVILTCSGSLVGGYGIKVTASSAALQDFTLSGGSTAVFGIHVQPGTSNTSIQGVTAHSCVQNGISLTGTNDTEGRNTITDITVHSNGLLGLGLGASQNVTVSDVTSYSNAFGDIGMYIGDYEGQPNDDLIFEEPLNLSAGFGGISYTIEANDPAGFEVAASTADATDALYNAAANAFVPAAYNHSVQVHVPESPFNADLTSYVLTQDAAAAIIAGALNVAPNDNVAVRNLETGAWEVSAGLSIGAAAGLAADGDAIEVAAGTYAESLTIDKGLSIDGGGSTLDVSGLGVGISIASDVDGVTISNFNVVGDASTYSGITVNPGASNVSILNNDISGMALSNPGNSSPLSYGILCWGNSDPINPPSNILIDGNEIHGVSGTAISLGDNTESVTISNNHFHSITQVLVNGAPWSSGVVAGTANNLAITGNNMDGLGYASVLTACTGVTLDVNQYNGGTSLMLLASLPNSILPDAAEWWSVEAAAIGYIYYFNSAAAQAATDAGLQAVGIPTVLSSSNPGCMDATACNYDATALNEDGSCTYPAHPNFDCNGDCLNDADGDGICDELEGLIPELETACGQGTVWDAALGQCIMDVGCIGDVDLDGAVTATDLLYLLGNFGSFCPGFGPAGGE